MKASRLLDQFENQAKADDLYWIERTKLDFAMALERQRRRDGVTYAALAERIGVSPAYVSKVFRGDSNLTIESMVKLARALRADLVLGVESEDAAKKWAWAGTVFGIAAANQSWRTGTGAIPVSQSIIPCEQSVAYG